MCCKNGINRIKTLKERQENVQELLETEPYTLKEKGFNPITEKTLVPIEINYEIYTHSTTLVCSITLFCKAF